MDLLEDGIGGRCPLERQAAGIIGGDEVVDALHELPYASEGAAADGLAGNQREEALDLIEPWKAVSSGHGLEFAGCRISPG